LISVIATTKLVAFLLLFYVFIGYYEKYWGFSFSLPTIPKLLPGFLAAIPPKQSDRSIVDNFHSDLLTENHR